MTTVRNYKASELINRMKSLPSYTHMPKGLNLVFVRSEKQISDTYNCKMYMFRQEKFLGVTSCTTRSGKYGLLNFFKWNKKGAAVIKFDEIYYYSFMKSDGKEVRHHNGKMQCLRLIKDLKYYRDNNKDLIVDESGKVYIGNFNTNIHCNSYKYVKGILTWLIGRWGTGCSVLNNLSFYYNALLKEARYNEPVTYTGLKEF